MDLRRQGRVVGAGLWLFLMGDLLLVIDAGRTRRAAVGHGYGTAAAARPAPDGAFASGTPARRRR
jgi:hypothetical protein